MEDTKILMTRKDDPTTSTHSLPPGGAGVVIDVVFVAVVLSLSLDCTALQSVIMSTSLLFIFLRDAQSIHLLSLTSIYLRLGHCCVENDGNSVKNV